MRIVSPESADCATAELGSATAITAAASGPILRLRIERVRRARLKTVGARKNRSTLLDCDMNNRRPLRRTSHSYTVFLALPLAAGLLAATAHGAAAQIPPPPTFAAPPTRPAPPGPLPTGTFLGGVPSGEPTGRAE